MHEESTLSALVSQKGKVMKAFDKQFLVEGIGIGRNDLSLRGHELHVERAAELAHGDGDSIIIGMMQYSPEPRQYTGLPFWGFTGGRTTDVNVHWGVEVLVTVTREELLSALVAGRPYIVWHEEAGEVLIIEMDQLPGVSKAPYLEVTREVLSEGVECDALKTLATTLVDGSAEHIELMFPLVGDIRLRARILRRNRVVSSDDA